jgi:hypothetical protein
VTTQFLVILANIVVCVRATCVMIFEWYMCVCDDVAHLAYTGKPAWKPQVLCEHRNTQGRCVFFEHTHLRLWHGSRNIWHNNMRMLSLVVGVCFFATLIAMLLQRGMQ